MPAKICCEHGVVPKRACKACNREYQRKRHRQNYSPAANRLKYEANKDTLVVRSQNSRAKRLGVPGTILLEDWRRKKAGGCVYCGATRYKLEIDHRIPLGRGGTNEPDNIQAACMFCNRAKHDLNETEFLEWLAAVRLIEAAPPPPRFKITFRWEPPRLRHHHPPGPERPRNSTLKGRNRDVQVAP